jgi:hypothetical protein
MHHVEETTHEFEIRTRHSFPGKTGFRYYYVKFKNQKHKYQKSKRASEKKTRSQKTFDNWSYA